MSDKLEQLTKQIYDEGVAKAKEEARIILEHAEEEKKKVLRAARLEAEDILTVARKEAEDLRAQVESELRMAAQQSMALLRQKITGMICEKVAESTMGGIFDDKNFLKKVTEVVMKEWVTSHCQGTRDFYIKLPENLQQDIKEYFLQKGRQELDKGLKIEFDEKIKSGFVIVPKDGSYRIGFTEDDFKSLVQYFLRPRLKQFLFGARE